jgi:hypothetical protein
MADNFKNIEGKIFRTLLGFLTIVCCGGVFLHATPLCQAQSMMGFGQEDLIRQVRETAAAMRQYRKDHDRFPELQPELDDTLKTVFKRVSLSQADTTIVPQSRNNFRTYYQFAIAVDPGIRSLTVINGQIKPPNSWNAPPNSIVILSDGQNQFAVWAAGMNGSPINDPTTNVPMIIHETIEPQPATP